MDKVRYVVSLTIMLIELLILFSCGGDTTDCRGGLGVCISSSSPTPVVSNIPVATPAAVVVSPSPKPSLTPTPTPVIIHCDGKKCHKGAHYGKCK